MPKQAETAGVGLAELAKLLRCDVSHIDGLAKKSIAVRLSRGRYDPWASAGNYIEHLREQAAGRAGRDEDVDPVKANTRLKTAQAELTELRTQKERGELISVEDVRSTWFGIMRAVRQAVLSLPNQIAFELPHLTVHDRGVVTRVCREGLDDAAMGRGFQIIPAEEVGEEDADG